MNVYLSSFLVVPMLSRCRHVGNSAGKLSSLLFSTEGKERDKKRAKQRERVAVDCVCLRQMKA